MPARIHRQLVQQVALVVTPGVGPLVYENQDLYVSQRFSVQHPPVVLIQKHLQPLGCLCPVPQQCQACLNLTELNALGFFRMHTAAMQQ